MQRGGGARAAALLSVIVLVAVLVAATVAHAYPSRGSTELVIAEQPRYGDTEFYRGPAEGSTVELTWIHSIEKEPWREIYVVRDGRLTLTDIYLKSYGAGVPSDIGGVTTNEHGVIHVGKIDREFTEISWVHSHATHHSITIHAPPGRENTIVTAGSRSRTDSTLSNEIPHHTFVHMFIRT